MFVILFLAILALAIFFMAHRAYANYRNPPIAKGWISHRKRNEFKVFENRDK
jgi:hypothetical protein